MSLRARLAHEPRVPSTQAWTTARSFAGTVPGFAPGQTAASQAGKAGADPRASFGIDMRDGFYSGQGHDVLIAKPSSKGGHGFAPTRSALHASLVMSGPDVPRSGNLGVVRMSQIGSTVASWFNATLSPEADRPLTWPARSGSVH